ncbi:hypothetical protein [Pseudomonas fulva]|uniref:hypothetical protein n=1 Tax=Pseudomonas fulva TaxID=47880 RepID=UPI001F4278E3|nr:hypothetical protein [Pseudomonas fulva]
MKSLASIWKSELLKRKKQSRRSERNDRNWPIHKAIGLKEFECFAKIARSDAVYFHVVDYCHSQASNENGPWYEGQDSIVLSRMDRFTGRQTHYESLSGSHCSSVFETGGSLVVHYTERQGLIQVFLTPPLTDGSIASKKEVLLWAGYNTDHLTRVFFRVLIEKYLIFCRVESSFDGSNFLERAAVRWWKYMDIRNRRNLFGAPDKFLNPWELSAAAAVFAVVGLIISIVT